ncbi:MAG: PEGA domain-containing protein [Byssovorax sp.]
MRRTALSALLSASLASSIATAIATSIVTLPAFAQGNGKGAQPPKSDEASEHFRSGVGFYKDHDFTAAMVEFKKAYELAPNYRVLYNIGQTARELRDYAAALAAFERYLREGGQEVPAARRKEVTTSVDDLKKKVGKLTITVSVAGADVSVDDTPLGAAPLAESITLNVGKHKLSATAAGYAPLSRVVEVAGSVEDTVSLDLVKIETAPPPPPVGPDGTPVVDPVKPVKTGTPIAVWAVGGVTVAGVIATGVMGGLAMSSRSSLTKALNTYPGDASAIADAQGKTKTFALITDIAGGVTLAGAITTAVLYAVSPRGDEAKPAPKVGVTVTPGGLWVQGAF